METFLTRLVFGDAPTIRVSHFFQTKLQTSNNIHNLSRINIYKIFFFRFLLVSSVIVRQWLSMPLSLKHSTRPTPPYGKKATFALLPSNSQFVVRLFCLRSVSGRKKPKPIHTVLRNFCRGAVVVCYHVPPRESLADWKYDFLFLANLARYPPLKLPMFWGYS